MNAPISPTALAPAAAAVKASDLVALPLIEKWIAFATVSRDSNLALLDWTEAYLNDLGITCSRTYDDSGQKANLWATLPAHDGETKIGGLVLSGHTDVVGPNGYNLNLSKRRAQRVIDHLTNKGIDPSRLQLNFFGKEQPVANNETDEGRHQNRRVEFQILEKKFELIQ